VAALGKLDALRGSIEITPETELLVQRARALLRGQRQLS